VSRGNAQGGDGKVCGGLFPFWGWLRVSRTASHGITSRTGKGADHQEVRIENTLTNEKTLKVGPPVDVTIEADTKDSPRQAI
jgi:hypothetical protein